MFKEITFNDVPAVLSRIDTRLNRIEQRFFNSPNSKEKKYLTIDEVALKIGCAKQTIYGKTSRGQIPHTKKSGKLLFESAKIDAWLLEGERNPIS